jgi:hypothetical protein
MEMHAHVPTVGKTVGHWLVEGLFIVISVALGFWVTQIREERQSHELVARVLNGLEAEVRYNIATLEPFIDIQQKWLDAMAKLGSATDRQTGFPCGVSLACGVFATCLLRSNGFPISGGGDTALTGRWLWTRLAADFWRSQTGTLQATWKVGVSSTDWFGQSRSKRSQAYEHDQLTRRALPVAADLTEVLPSCRRDGPPLKHSCLLSDRGGLNGSVEASW